MLAVYAPFVQKTAVTFEVTTPPAGEFERRVAAVLKQAPWLVCERSGTVLGYAYASEHRPREAFRWSVDSSIYVGEGHQRRGIGRALYEALMGCLRLQGYYNVYAGITLPNQASVGLHEALGFQHVATFRSEGYKLGAWHDVGWWQLALREHHAQPLPPRLLSEVVKTQEWRKILDQANARLRGHRGASREAR